MQTTQLYGASAHSSVRIAVLDVTNQLTAVGIEDARLEAEVLVAHVMGTDRTHLLASLNDPLPAAAALRLGDFVRRRLEREPLAYILGWREFHGLHFVVRPGVLIPRPETETLVDEALTWLSTHQLRAVADVGCGSGVIAIAIAHGAPQVRLYAIDESPVALATTAENALRLGVADRVRVSGGDLLGALAGHVQQVNLVVANLPYVRAGELAGLQPEVRREPPEALDGGPYGLKLVRRLVAQLSTALAPGGAAMLECDPRQASTLSAELASALPLARVRVVPDLSGRPRVVIAETET